MQTNTIATTAIAPPDAATLVTIQRCSAYALAALGGIAPFGLMPVWILSILSAVAASLLTNLSPAEKRLTSAAEAMLITACSLGSSVLISTHFAEIDQVLRSILH